MQVALVQMAAQTFQEHQLLRQLHALGDHCQPQTASHGDNGADDFRVIGVVGGVAHERLVDFQGVHRQALEVGQRRIACAEIVHGETDAQFVQAPHLADCVLQVLDHDAFGDFQLQHRGRQVVAGQCALHAFDEIGLAELSRADVHAQAEGVADQSFAEQGTEGLAGVVEDPGADFEDQSAVFQDLDEFGR